MDNRVNAVEIYLFDIADIAFDDCERGVRLEEITEPHNIEGGDAVAFGQQLRHEHAALISARTRYKNTHPPRSALCEHLVMALNHFIRGDA